MRTLACYLLTCAFALAPLCSSQAEEIGALRVESLVLGPRLEEPITATLTVERAGGFSQQKGSESLRSIEKLRQVISVPSSTPLQLPVGTLVHLRVEASGWWAPSTAVLVETQTEVLISLRPTGTLKAQLEAPRGHVLPDEMEVRITGTPKKWREAARDSEPPRIEGLHDILCPITEGHLDCGLPAGPLDVRLRAQGFASVQRWELAIPAGESRDLGTVKLTPGASVVGRVGIGPEALETELPFEPQEVTLKLTPRSTGISTSRAMERQDSLTLETKADERGFYQLTEVPAGSYTLEAHHEGLAAGTLEPVQVHGGQETQLVPLELLPPRRLTVKIQPPTDPFRKPWSIRVLKTGAVSSLWHTAAEGVSQAEGRFEATALQPGPHAVIVEDSRGGSWKRQEVNLVDRHTTHEITLPFGRLEALVLLDDEPLTSAIVHFGGRSSYERISRRTDEEGKVYVFLPWREEGWIADVEHRGLGLRTRVEGITLDREPDQPWAKTVIEVPDTKLFGEVVDEAGLPFPNSQVDVSGPRNSQSPNLTVPTDDEAIFEARGLPPGTWSVEGSAYDEATRTHFSIDRETFEVPESSPTGPIRLVARRKHVVTGQVVSPTGEGLPGALVVAVVEHGTQLLTSGVEYKHTGSDGTFELRLPGRAPAVVLTIFPPGFAVRQERLRLPASGPLLLPVDPATGTLVVRSADGETEPDLFRSSSLFGPYLMIGPFLDRWAGMHTDVSLATEPGILVLPGLEPREYSVCDLPPSDAVLLGATVPEEACDRGYLRPGGVLELTVPSPPEDPPAAEGR